MINENEILNLINNFEAYDNSETTAIILEYAKLKNNINNFRDDKTVYVLVGPSGSGKSTLIANMYKHNIFGNTEHDFVPFVNRHYSNQSMSLRQEINFKSKLLGEGKSFMIESAQFDEDYSDFIKVMKLKYDYKICLLYLTKWHPKENISMVQKRKTEGGHGTAHVELNEDVIKQMYRTDSKNLVEIMPFCDSCFVINNKTKIVGQDYIKPVVLLQKKLDGEIIYDSNFKYANFLYRRILKSEVNGMSFNGFCVRVANTKYFELLKRKGRCAKVFRELPLNRQIELALDRIKAVSIEDARTQYTEEQMDAILKGSALDSKNKK